LKNSPKNLFEEYTFIKKKRDILPKNIEVIRGNTLNNIILKTLFYFNQYLNKKTEIFFNRKLYSEVYHQYNKEKFSNPKLVEALKKSLFYQRLFINPNFYQIYHILKKIHKNQKLRLIHSAPINFTSTNFAYQFSKKNKITFICTPFYHINPYKPPIYLTYQYILKNSNAIIACTNLEKDYYVNYGVEKNNIHIIPPGIEPNIYEKPNVEQFKQNYKISKNAPILLFMARRSFEKGFIQCIFALKTLIKKFKDIKLLIAGSMTRDYQLFYNKLPTEIKSHIIDLGIIVGQKKVDAIASCDVFIMPSLDDAFGIVYLEAWLFKKPVIGASEGNVAGLIDNGKNGYLVPFKNIKNLASKIELLLMDKSKRENLGNNGYNKLMNNYTLDITNKKVLNLYNKFIS